MRTETQRITLPRRGRSAEVASFLAQLDELSRTMLGDLGGIRPAELAWQPKRGQNSIGMLLAHIAIVEVYWSLVALERSTPERLLRVLGIGIDDDGMPIARDAAPPARLRGRTLRWYAALLRRGRAFARRTAARFSPADLESFVTRTRKNGQRVRTNRRWIYYHLLEHLAGHYGQILLLRHQYADRKRR